MRWTQFTRPLAAAGLLTIAAVLGACSSGDDESSPIADSTAAAPIPSTSPDLRSTSTIPSSTTVPAVELSTLTDPSNARNIGYAAPPGRYVTDRLGVPTEVVLDEQLEFINLPGHLSFAPLVATPRDPIGLFIHNIIGIVPTDDMATPRDVRSVPDVVDAVPDMFDAWFEAESRIDVTDQGASTIAGRPAPWWDFQVDAEAGDTYQCGFGQCVTFVVDPNIGATVLGDEWRYRIWKLEAFDESTVIAFLEATPETWDDTLIMAEDILQSLTITAR